MYCSDATLLNYCLSIFQDGKKKERVQKYDVTYDLEPILKPKSHHAYSWLKTAEHMSSALTLGPRLTEGYPEVRISPSHP